MGEWGVFKIKVDCILLFYLPSPPQCILAFNTTMLSYQAFEGRFAKIIGSCYKKFRNYL